MTSYQIVSRAGVYRIEATTPTGERWLLSRIYTAKKPAMKRLNALRSMGDAIMSERSPG
jgi:hypothetical protein